MPLGGLWFEVAAVDPSVDDPDVVELAVDGHRVLPVRDVRRKSWLVRILREVENLDELSLDLADVFGHPHVKPPRCL